MLSTADLAAMGKALMLVKVVMMVLATIPDNGAAASSRQLDSWSSSSVSSEEGVVTYWAQRLQGMNMPPMLRAMVTSVNTNDADFLTTSIRSSVLHPNAHSYLPSNAASFCSRTRIVCDRKSYIPNSPFSYLYVEGGEVNHGGFFREKQVLVKGARIEISNPQKDNDGYEQPRTFLPRGLAKLFPFTQEGLPKLASLLSISKEAIPSMQETISECSGQAGLPGEIVTCPTSIESMADFVASTMGSEKPLHVLDFSRPMHGIAQTVLDVKTVKGDPNDKYVTCHDMTFPFRVFYCHFLQQTKLFVATLQATDGSIHDRTAVCHYDTSHWNPKHVSFSDLGTTPGESEACHWMAESGLVFLHK